MKDTIVYRAKAEVKEAVKTEMADDAAELRARPARTVVGRYRASELSCSSASDQ